MHVGHLHRQLSFGSQINRPCISPAPPKLARGRCGTSDWHLQLGGASQRPSYLRWTYAAHGCGIPGENLEHLTSHRSFRENSPPLLRSPPVGACGPRLGRAGVQEVARCTGSLGMCNCSRSDCGLGAAALICIMGLQPESTLQAFAYALEIGSNVLEMSTCLSKMAL